jgi:hypothetical protein
MSWDHPKPAQGDSQNDSPSLARVHQERARAFEELPSASFNQRDSPPPPAKRVVRIRRPDPGRGQSYSRAEGSGRPDMPAEDGRARAQQDRGVRDEMEGASRFRQNHDLPPPPHGRASLLDRLSLDAPPAGSPMLESPSLRERVQIPAKRARDEVMADGVLYDGGVEAENGEGKRSRKRGPGKARRGKRNGGAQS